MTVFLLVSGVMLLPHPDSSMNLTCQVSCLELDSSGAIKCCVLPALLARVLVVL